MAGVNPEDLLEEGFAADDLANMKGRDDSPKEPVEGAYLVAGNVVASVSRHFVTWSLAFGDMIGIHIPKATFGLQASRRLARTPSHRRKRPGRKRLFGQCETGFAEIGFIGTMRRGHRAREDAG